MENQEAFMLETQHVSKHYGKLEVLKDINLQVKKGEVICLIGPSGAGKSTYLRSLNQLETITGGKIFIKGHLLLHREHDHTVERIDKKTQQQLLLETLRVLKKGGTFAIHDLMSPRRYGDMHAFVQKLRDMGYERVELIDTTDGSFMTPKEAKRLMLRGSTLLVGRK